MKGSNALKWTAVLLATAAPAVVRAEAPALLPVQGYLTDSMGAPVNGSVNAQIRLYDAEMGGNILFTDLFSVVVDQGVFTVYLGSSVSVLDLGIFDSFEAVYLGIQVGNDPEMTPRVRLATAPYAAYSNMCGDSALLGGQPPASYASAGHTHPAPDWTSITGIPAGFADGTDYGEVYSAGAGLSLAGTTFSVSGVTGAMITDSTVDTVDLANLAVGTAKLQNSAVTAAKLAADAVDSSKIIDATIALADLTTGSVDSSKILDATIVAADLANNAVTAAKIAPGTITSAEIAVDTISSADLAVDSVTASEIAAGAVGTAELADGAVTAVKIAAGAITSNEIAADTITAADLAPGAVTASELGAGAVGAAAIGTDAVTADEIATDAVGSAEIAVDAVGSAEIAALAVNTAELAADSVTTGKLAADAVTSPKIATDAVIASKIASDSIASGKLQSGAVTMRELNTILGGYYQSTDVSMGASPADSFAATVVTPTDNGVCMVVASAYLTDNTTSPNPATTDSAYLRVAMQNVATAGVTINSFGSYFAPFQDGVTTQTNTHVFSVSSGVSYQFGCRVYFTGEWLSENVGACNVSWVCQ